MTRFDPFRDVDRLAERLFTAASDVGQAARAMPMDLYRSGDHYVLHVDLPGVDPGSVDVGVDGRVLTVRAQRSPRGEDLEWLTQERPVGSFARQLTLGSGLDLDRIEATYEDGVLTVTLPVAEQARPRRIEVAHRAGRQAVAGSAAGSVGSVGSAEQQAVEG
ncbi:Hsp20/alpha crystallin family protein [Vallicoccus soli]|uniref:Hsp20/alpha crystallin family protein n=1 Tax=Vallicoccus soli TaxID=2339232 RepID=A0A3A3Z8N4_9ACTN|nr:Hsp20/alpha crystallin family protein [Vallicoccus soli]RJK97197.1 Hsp20/alpha crystallin family protein [Vallicoccus soli]